MKLNILIPCAGEGQRFKELSNEEPNYLSPKPFILTQHLLMIEWVIENMLSEVHDINFSFIFRDDQLKSYDIDAVIKAIVPKGCEYQLVNVNGMTDGAARTIYMARNRIDLDLPLVIANSDQYISKFDIDRFIGWASKDDCSILTFKSNDSKWSFIDPKDEVHVHRVVEKEPISDIANTGIFYYRAGKDAMWAIKEMIDKEIKFRNEYYLAPSINELVQDNADVTYKMIEEYQTMWGLGTPHDHKYFEKNYR